MGMVAQHMDRKYASFDGDGAIALCAVMGVTAFLGGLMLLIEDLIIPSWRACATPLGAMKAFFISIQHKRWSYPYALMLPLARAGILYRRPESEEMRLTNKVVTFSQASRFQAYWKDLMEPTETVGCRAVFDRYENQTSTEVDAICSVRYKAETYERSQWGSGGLALVFFLLLILSCIVPFLLFVFLIALPMAIIKYLRTRRTSKVTFTKWLHRVGDTWYFVTGDVFSGEDMLPKLYHDCMEKLYAGELPAEEILARAAGFGEGCAHAVVFSDNGEITSES